MTLEDILANVADQDRGKEFELADPVDGASTGIKLWIVGPDSETAHRARLALSDELAAMADAEGRVTAEQREKARLNCLARHVLRWEVVEDGKPVPFNTANLLRLLRVHWCAEQVDAFAADRARAPERRVMDHLDLAIRFDASGDEGQFTGHAVIWDERNGHNETVQRGAFKRSLLEHRQAGTKPLMLWSHNPSEIIGVWTEVREDEKGLAVTGKIVTSTARGREAYDLLKAGALNGLSIGFRSRGDKRGPNGVRVLTDIDLAEISIVGLPSAGRARITSVRSHGRSVESAAAFVAACRKAKCALVSKGK